MTCVSFPDNSRSWRVHDYLSLWLPFWL